VLAAKRLSLRLAPARYNVAPGLAGRLRRAVARIPTGGSMSAHPPILAFAISIPKPLSLVLIALVAIVLAFGAYTIVTGVADFLGPKRTSWKLVGPSAGTELQIGVDVGGCDQFKRISVSEDDEEVVIKAYIRKGSHRGDDACSELKTVKLSAPLGSRALRGCNPDSSVYRVEGLSDRDCAAGNVITEWPAMQKLTDLLDGIVNASYQPSSGVYLASYGIGFRESEDGKVYIEVAVQGIDVTSLREEIPNEIASYKVRLLQPSPSP